MPTEGNPLDEAVIRSLFEKDVSKWEKTDWEQFESMVKYQREACARYREAEQATKVRRAKQPVSDTYD